MLTVDDIFAYTERVIAEDRLSGNRAGLLNTQRSCGYLMTAAEFAGDKESARRFRILAAQAANKNEELAKERP